MVTEAMARIEQSMKARGLEGHIRRENHGWIFYPKGRGSIFLGMSEVAARNKLWRIAERR